MSRPTTGSLTSSEKIAGVVAPYWVKLTRTGDLFTGYRSVDGVSWTAFTSVTIPMALNAYIGLAAASHDDGTLGTSVFDNVDVMFAGHRAEELIKDYPLLRLPYMPLPDHHDPSRVYDHTGRPMKAVRIPVVEERTNKATVVIDWVLIQGPSYHNPVSYV